MILDDLEALDVDDTIVPEIDTAKTRGKPTKFVRKVTLRGTR